MADELPARLADARRHFANQAFDEALKALAACPQDDPKVVHNTAMCQYATKPGNYRATIAKLELPSIQKVKSLKTGTFTTSVVLQYDGQETALLNAAAIFLHNGSTTEARNLLLALANSSATFSPASRMRVALMLHVAARRSSVDVSEITSSLLSDAGSAAADDPALQQMMSIAYSDAPGLHHWFAGSSKSPMERALYLNNLGVEAFADGKAAVAGVFFARAAQSAKDGCKFVAHSIAYNGAVCALSRGAEGSGAVQALLMAQGSMTGSPMLWVRLGQALLDRFHDASATAANADFDKEVEERVHALHTGTLPGFPAIPPHQVRVTSSTSALLNAAAQALQNALSLLVEKSERIVDAARRLAQPGGDMPLVLDAVLSMLAYIELTRGNYGVVVAIAVEYSAMERDVKPSVCPRTQAAMACYHVEALCAANRMSQALRVLQQMNLGHFVSIKAPNATIEALMVNVCVTYITTGQWGKAVQLSQQLVTKIPSPAAQLLMAYLDLASGNVPAAAETVASLPQRAVPLA